MAGRQVGERPLDAAFRQVIGRFMSGVVVITATHQGDLDLARDIIIRHTARAKQTQRRGIERAGGQL
jgi:hypothetical protein